MNHERRVAIQASIFYAAYYIVQSTCILALTASTQALPWITSGTKESFAYYLFNHPPFRNPFVACVCGIVLYIFPTTVWMTRLQFAWWFVFAIAVLPSIPLWTAIGLAWQHWDTIPHPFHELSMTIGGIIISSSIVGYFFTAWVVYLLMQKTHPDYYLQVN